MFKFEIIMLNRIIKFVVAAALLALTVMQFVDVKIWNGILLIILLAVVVLLLFRHERMIFAMFSMRKGDIEKASKHLEAIKDPEAFDKKQKAYFFYLKGLTGAQTRKMGETESLFKKALSTGLKSSTDQAVCKMNLAAIAMQKRRKREATNLLSEAKKLDAKGVLDDQIKQLKKQMTRI